MIVARLYLGPHDGQRLVLPCPPEDPWPRYVIPQFGKLVIEHLYLYSGRLGEDFTYLYEDDWDTLLH